MGMSPLIQNVIMWPMVLLNALIWIVAILNVLAMVVGAVFLIRHIMHKSDASNAD